jgi:hypothetical protein
MAFRHPSRRNPVLSDASANPEYGDGGFFFTQPVGRPTGRVEPGSGHPDANDSVTASIPFGQGGPFDSELVSTNANYTRTTYGDGGYYFLSPVNTPNYGGLHGDAEAYAGAARPHRMYGVAAPSLKNLNLRSSGVRTATDKSNVGQNREQRRAARTETSRGAAVASAALITAYQNALVQQGKAQFWADFWSGRPYTSGSSSGIGFGSTRDLSSKSKEEVGKSNDALNTARRAVATAKQAYLAGLPADVVANLAFVDAIRKFEETYAKKGWFDEAYAGVKGDVRSVSKVAIGAIKRDVFEAYATRAVTYEAALALGKKYVLGNVQYEWQYDEDGGKNRIGATFGFTKDNFEYWGITPYGTFDDTVSLNGEQFPGKKLKGKTKRDTSNAVGTTTYEGSSYSGGLVWYYEGKNFPKAHYDDYQRADRYWLIRHRFFGNKALFGNVQSKAGGEVAALRTTQDNDRRLVENALTSVVSTLAAARKGAVEIQISAEQAERAKQDAARLAGTRRADTQRAAEVVKGHALTAASKRAAAETAAAAMDVTLTTTAAGEADTSAKAAEAALAAVRTAADATAAANTASDNRAGGEKTAAEGAYLSAEQAVAQARAEAESATKQIEVARLAKEAAEVSAREAAARQEEENKRKALEQAQLAAAQGSISPAEVAVLQQQYETAKAETEKITAASDAADKKVEEARVEAQEAKTPPQPQSLLLKPKMEKVGIGPTDATGEGLSMTVKVAIGVGVLAAAGGAYWWFKIRPKGVK